MIVIRMKIVILTGPPAAGKNTVGQALAEIRTKSALIDVDQLRWILRKPHVPPWKGEEGVRQTELGIRNACLLGQQFLAYGCDVITLDFLWPYSLNLYREGWADEKIRVVRLMPPLVTCVERNRARGQWLTDDEVQMLYKQMEAFEGYELSIDNEHLSAVAAAERISALVDHAL